MSARSLHMALELAEAGARVQGQLDDALGPGRASVGAVIKQDARALVARGVFEGGPVFFKQMRGAQPVRDAKRAAAELRFLQTHLAEGPHRVMPLRAALVAPAILITGAVQGRSVADVLQETSDDRERATLLGRASEWLGAVAALRPGQQELQAAQRLAKLKPPVAKATPDVRQALQALHQDLCKMVEDMGPQMVRHGPAHADFTQKNLIWDGAQLWGVDIQGAHPAPLLHMMARFSLGQNVWRRPQDLAALHPARFSAGADFAQVFRFALGWEMYRRYSGRAYANQTGLVCDDIAFFLSGWMPPAAVASKAAT
ncbi:hypothetical protein [Shimia marina]|nr:hypothetical protein [Shimia marina]SFE50881.1 hypothetical protein SAMN04488037_11088 [Shimia marina]